MTVVVGWAIVSMALVVLMVGLLRLPDVGPGLFAVAGCVAVLAASQLVPSVLPRILVIIGGELAVGASLGLWFARGAASAAVLVGVVLVAGLLAVQLAAPSGEAGAGDAFAITGMVVVAALVWALIMLGYLAGLVTHAVLHRPHPADS